MTIQVPELHKEEPEWTFGGSIDNFKSLWYTIQESSDAAVLSTR